jgi:hypothetical protein
MMEQLTARMTANEYAFFTRLDTPGRIQAFLDDLAYPSDTKRNRSPLNTLRERQGHCLDGALFAAAALRRLGYPPRLVDLFPEPGTDDDHVLAVYRQHGHYGALAKSNFTTLRARSPVYRSLRELVMSYFDGYFNQRQELTLRTYTRPVSLLPFDRQGWLWEDAGADAIETHLLGLPRRSLISPEAADRLEKVDPLTYQAATLVTNPEGLFRPGEAGKG